MTKPLAVEHLRSLREALTAGLIERECAVKLALLATLAGEHLLLIGPPGTAKSMIAQRLRHACTGVYFERLLTKFTVPEELFGPLSIKGLEQDRYERLTTGYLPMATVAFLDEIFKANSAILNALLTLLNEREFDNGTRRERTPLLALVGASNELPKGDELSALYDRFLLRLHVEPVSKQGFQSLLQLGSERLVEIPADLRLTREGIAATQAAAAKVTLPADVQQLLAELRLWCQEQKIPVSDRRWRKIVKLLRTSAASNGWTEVSVWDCWLLQFCCGDGKEEGRKVYEWYERRVGATKVMDPARLTKLVATWESQLLVDKSREAQQLDAAGRRLFLDANGKVTTEPVGSMPAFRNGEPLYLAPTGWSGARDGSRDNHGKGFTESDLSQFKESYHSEYFRDWHGRKQYLAAKENRFTTADNHPPQMGPLLVKPAHKAQCLRELEAVKGDIQAYLSTLEAHLSSLRTLMENHLWLDKSFATPASAQLAEKQKATQHLLARIQQVHEGYQGLPVEQLLSASADISE